MLETVHSPWTRIREDDVLKMLLNENFGDVRESSKCVRCVVVVLILVLPGYQVLVVLLIINYKDIKNIYFLQSSRSDMHTSFTCIMYIYNNQSVVLFSNSSTHLIHDPV